MSFDDAVQGDDDPAPTMCDACQDTMANSEPHPVLGWPLMVFECTRCGREFCQHLDVSDGGLVCPGCAELQKGSTRWPTVPPDATAQDPLHPNEPVEYFQDGHGPGALVLIVLIVIVILIAAAYLAMITGGGAR